MKLTEMKELLERHEIQLTKSLGQNFLHDSNLLDKIAAAGELTAADQVLEIGPGLGPLTERLIQSGAHVLAVELDGRLVEMLDVVSESFQQGRRLQRQLFHLRAAFSQHRSGQYRDAQPLPAPTGDITHCG